MIKKLKRSAVVDLSLLQDLCGNEDNDQLRLTIIMKVEAWQVD